MSREILAGNFFAASVLVCGYSAMHGTGECGNFDRKAVKALYRRRLDDPRRQRGNGATGREDEEVGRLRQAAEGGDHNAQFPAWRQVCHREGRRADDDAQAAH